MKKHADKNTILRNNEYIDYGEKSVIIDGRADAISDAPSDTLGPGIHILETKCVNNTEEDTVMAEVNEDQAAKM